MHSGSRWTQAWRDLQQVHQFIGFETIQPTRRSATRTLAGLVGMQLRWCVRGCVRPVAGAAVDEGLAVDRVSAECMPARRRRMCCASEAASMAMRVVVVSVARVFACVLLPSAPSDLPRNGSLCRPHGVVVWSVCSVFALRFCLTSRV
uniref:Uncharacterized protein n=1 Tax=Haptolina ericina TaxID=156174 RepID=A0A7S3F8R0_9EUKA|mmetsp:Transcript_5556/g.12033  ORF Transcript_5556/g.12033 Transcript_5556/m.12033 type:complete len:148 (+) Transcript_5556:84-527(+)